MIKDKDIYSYSDLIELIKSNKLAYETEFLINSCVDLKCVFENDELYRVYNNNQKVEICQIYTLKELSELTFEVVETTKTITSIKLLDVSEQYKKDYAPIIIDNREKINEIAKAVNKMIEQFNKN